MSRSPDQGLIIAGRKVWAVAEIAGSTGSLRRPQLIVGRKSTWTVKTFALVILDGFHKRADARVGGAEPLALMNRESTPPWADRLEHRNVQTVEPRNIG